MPEVDTNIQTLGDPDGAFEVYPVMEFKGFPAHRHLFYEIAYFSHGGGVLCYNGRNHRIRPPMLHICPPKRAWHEIKCAGTEVWTSSIAIYPKLLPPIQDETFADRDAVSTSNNPALTLDYLSDHAPPLIPLSSSGSLRVSALIDVMCEESRLMLTGHKLRCRACIVELLVLALREMEGTGSPQVRAESSPQASPSGGISREPHVSNAMALMRNNFRRVLPNEELAQLVGLDTKYFTRLFKREVGLSPQRYYLRLRLEAAAHQMIQSRLSIQQIAEMFGFKSRSHFQNQFKRQFQSSPGVYRYYRRPGGQ